MLKSPRASSLVSPFTLALLCGAVLAPVGFTGCSGSSGNGSGDTSGSGDDSSSTKDAGKKKDAGKTTSDDSSDDTSDDSSSSGDDASPGDDASIGDDAGGGSNGKDAGGGAGADSGGGGGGGTGTSPAAQYLPTVSGTCPTLATGMVTVSGQQVQIWSGAAGTNGTLVMYWHGTGEQSSNAALFFGQAQISAVTAAGGIVAAFNSSTKQGTSTAGPDTVFYTGDFAIADQVVACAIKQNHIDPRRIYVTGDSAGGLQSVAMYYARSGYLAAVATNSGGLFQGLNSGPLQDPSNVPPAMAIHGAESGNPSDVVGINFADTSATWENDVKAKGGFSIDCNTGGGHDSGPPGTGVAMWQFFKDHPFKVKPEPYTSTLPAAFPAYCHVGPRKADGGI